MTFETELKLDHIIGLVIFRFDNSMLENSTRSTSTKLGSINSKRPTSTLQHSTINILHNNLYRVGQRKKVNVNNY